MMGEGRLGAQPGEAAPTHWEAMDEKSAQMSSIAEALDLDHGVGGEVPAPVLKGAEMSCTLLTGVHR